MHKIKCSKLQRLFKTGHKDRYDLICSIDMYDKEHLKMPSVVSSGGGIPMTSTSSKNHFTLLVTQSTFLTIGFNALITIIIIEFLFIKVRWVSYLKQYQITSSKKRGDDCKENFQTIIRAVGW